MKQIIYPNNTVAERGDVIRWNCWDSDDNILYTFTGVYNVDHIIYLSGGMDFGSAIGKILTIEEVLLEAEDNDDGMNKIDYVCNVSNLVNIINNI